MNTRKKNTKFYFEPNIHVNYGENNILVYNYSTKEKIIIKNVTLFHKIKNMLNNIESFIEIETKEEKYICQKLVSSMMGELIECPDNEMPLIIPTNFYKIEKNQEFYAYTTKRSTEYTFYNYLLTFNVYLDLKISNGTDIQFSHIFNQKKNENLDNKHFLLLNRIIDSIKPCANFTTLNLFFSNFNSITSNLFKLIFNNNLNNLVTLHLPFPENTKSELIYSKIDKVFYIPIKDIHLLYNKDFSFINESNKLVFIIEEENQIHLLDSFVQEKCVTDFIVLPYYNKQNLSFFKKNVYSDIETLLDSDINEIDIIRNSEINYNYFGAITVNMNGDCYNNSFCKKIGNILERPIEQIIDKCLLDKDSEWFSTRLKVEPCNKCEYNRLCPPLSNYEKVIERNNLCWKQ